MGLVMGIPFTWHRKGSTTLPPKEAKDVYLGFALGCSSPKRIFAVCEFRGFDHRLNSYADLNESQQVDFMNRSPAYVNISSFLKEKYRQLWSNYEKHRHMNILEVKVSSIFVSWATLTNYMIIL